ncbi:hypothetical protein RchiOBHm_Chr1g0341401 [Rosa chinensis]|uniref:Uncharacterized protein n=1 Tax=Rosa chinensis TaxID=74649 RepID=A0A2P6SDQ3_ROSCH|nr:hypothetical protein RchiOBHm_Chr1g0341401 [Rosa chinensis]
MDKGVTGKEALKEVTRESLIAISYSEPEKKLTSDKLNGETLVKAIDSDGEDKFRSELISISYTPSSEFEGFPVTNGELKD